MDKPSVFGIVEECLPNSQFRVTTDDGRSVIAYAAGKIKMNRIRILVGDRVRVELDPAGGKTTNRLVWREKV